jgi:hypothetical protein
MVEKKVSKGATRLKILIISVVTFAVSITVELLSSAFNAFFSGLLIGFLLGVGVMLIVQLVRTQNRT